MSVKTNQQLKEDFAPGKKVTWEQLADLIDSMRNAGVKIPAIDINGLSEIYNSTYTGEAKTDTVPSGGKFQKWAVYSVGVFSGFLDEFGDALTVDVEDLNGRIVDFIGENGVYKKVSTEISSPQQVYVSGKNKFDKSAVVNGKYVDPIDGSVYNNVNRTMTTKIPVLPSTNYCVSGLGTVHHGLAIRFTTALGVYVSFIVSAMDVTAYAFATPVGAYFMEMTVLSGKASENTNIDNVQIEMGAAATGYEAYEEFVVGLGSRKISISEVPVIPTSATSPISKQYFDNNALTSLEYSPAGKNIFDKAKIIDGFYVDIANGNLVPSSTYRVSSLIPATAGSYTLSGVGNLHYNLGVRFLNEANALVGFGTIAALNSTAGTVVAPIGTTKLQFTVKTNPVSGDNTDINVVQLEYGSVATSYVPVENAASVIEGKEILATRAPLVPNSPYSPVSKAFLDANAVSGIGSVVAGKNLFDKTKIINGFYVDVANGVLTANSNYKVTELIPVSENSSMVVSGLGNIHYALGLRFLNVSNALIGYGSAALLNSTVGAFITPAGTAKLQFTIKTNPSGGDNTNIDTVQLEYGTVPTSYAAIEHGIRKLNGIEISAKYGAKGGTDSTSVIVKADFDERLPFTDIRGKSMICFGDSITRTTGITNWPTYAIPLLGIGLFVNYAESGGSFTDFVGFTTPRQKMSVQVNDALAAATVPDICVVSMGTNDFAKVATLLGNYDTAMGKNIADLDRTLIFEAMRWNFYTLTNAWPNAKFFMGLPLQRANMTIGQMAVLLDAIRKMAGSYGFTIIDAATECGIIRDFEVQGADGRYLADGLHPKTNGKMLQGFYYARKIKANI